MSGSGSGVSPTYDDLLNMNISIPMKPSLADLLRPVTALSALRGKIAEGVWSLVLSTPHQRESTLVGWSLRIAREPNISPQYDYNTNTLVLTGADSAENYEKVIRSVQYDNMAERPDFSVVRSVLTTIFDGEDYSNSSLASSRSYIIVHHIDIDLDPADQSDAPSPGYTTQFQEHGSPIPVLDPDSALLGDEAYSQGQYTLTVRLTDYQNAGQEGLTWNQSATPNLLNTTSIIPGDAFMVTISSEPGDLRPIQEFETILRSFEYYNDAEEFIGSDRTVEFSVMDMQMNSDFISDVAVTTISLRPTNDLPILVLNSHRYRELDRFSNEVEFTEGRGPIPLTNASAITLTDNDHTHLTRVTVMILNPQDGDREILSTDTSDTLISAQYNTTTHTLLLMGNDNYKTALGNVKYDNTVHSPRLPGTEPRQISFVPFDGTHNGQAAIARVTFAAVNDAPMGDLNGDEPGTGTNRTFVEEGAPIRLLSQNASFLDADNNSLAYVEVRIVDPLAPVCDGH